MTTTKRPDGGEQTLSRDEAMQESAYLAGVKAGWNLCVTDDHDGYNSIVESREGYLRFLKPPTPAPQPPVEGLREEIRLQELRYRMFCQLRADTNHEELRTTWDAIEKLLDATALASPPLTAGKPVAWLCDLQPDAEDEALAVCNRIDPGAFPVYAAPATLIEQSDSEKT